MTANGKHSGPAVQTGTLPQGSCVYFRSVLRERERHAVPVGSPEAAAAIARVKWRLENERPSRILVINQRAPWQDKP